MKFNIKKFIFILVFTLLIFLLIFLCNIVYTSFIGKLFFENYVDKILNENANGLFKIDKIVFFSSANADSSINSNSSTTINNLSQYTDIAIFINNSVNDFSMSNTLKSVAIKNFSFNTTPSLGNNNLYYKSLMDFATPNVIPDNIVNSDLSFSISSENEIDYSKPILFNNCANPITMSYVNSNIVGDYTIDNSDDSMVYDGSLLKKCNVLLNDLLCDFSFTVYIENNLGQKFKCPVYIDVPLQDEFSSIYDGNYTYTYNPNYVFYMYDE